MAESRADFTIRGIESERDVRDIRDELDGVEGVMGTKVDPDSGEAQILYDEDILAEEKVKRTVRELGYEVE